MTRGTIFPGRKETAKKGVAHFYRKIERSDAASQQILPRTLAFSKKKKVRILENKTK
jgi:hypothetical protein